MSDSMVERVTRAIEKNPLSSSDPAYTGIFTTPEEIAEGYRDMARAAIEAMREPTDEMVSAAGSAWGSALEAQWRTMIDAAISGGKP